MQELSNEKGILYWAYDSTMGHEQLMRICPDAIHMGIATLEGYRLNWCTYHGWPTILRKPSSCVYGVLWHIPPGSILELTNAAYFDGYDQVNISVRGKQGQQRATAFLLSPRLLRYATVAKPSSRELRHMKQAYKQNGIPLAHLHKVREECRREVRESIFQPSRKRKRRRVCAQPSFPDSFHN